MFDTFHTKYRVLAFDPERGPLCNIVTVSVCARHIVASRTAFQTFLIVHCIPDFSPATFSNRDIYYLDFLQSLKFVMQWSGNNTFAKIPTKIT